MGVYANPRNIKSQFVNILLSLIKYQLIIYNRKLCFIIIILYSHVVDNSTSENQALINYALENQLLEITKQELEEAIRLTMKIINK